MATIASFKTMFQRLGFSEDAATQLSSDNSEGLLSFDAIKALSDTRVHAVCKAVRCPGGADQGHQVSERSEHNMTICAFVVNLWIRTSRDSKDVSDLVIQPDTLFIRAERQKDLGSAWDNSEHQDMFAALKSGDLEKRFTDLFEGFVDSLQNVRRVTGIPLKYLTRKTILPTDDANDPATAYSTLDDEMTARARIILAVNEADADIEDSGPEKRT